MLPVLRERLKENGSPPPEFETDADRSFFLIRLPVHLDADLAQPEEEERPASRTTSEKTSEKIVRLMKENRAITIAQLSEFTGVTTRSIERNLKTLQDHGRIRRVGGDHGGHWEVREET